MNTKEKLAACPIWERASLTLEEASAYTGIGVNKLRDMSDEPDCDYVFWVGNKRMLKRNWKNISMMHTPYNRDVL